MVNWSHRPRSVLAGAHACMLNGDVSSMTSVFNASRARDSTWCIAVLLSSPHVGTMQPTAAKVAGGNDAGDAQVDERQQCSVQRVVRAGGAQR